MTTSNILIEDALIDLGKLSPSEDIDPNDLAHGLRVLNRLLAHWATQRLLIPYTTSDNFTADGSASYTMGTTGTASSVRALRVISAYANDGTTDQPLKIIGQEEYNRISIKSTTGRPYFLFYDPQYASGYVYMYPVPGASYTIYLESIKYIDDALSIASPTNDVSLSAEYQELIILGLRNRLAGSFGVQVTPLMLKEFDDALRDVKNLNSSTQTYKMQMPSGLPSTGGVKYDISADLP